LTLLNDTERFVIELAAALTQTPSNVSDDLYARLRNQFSEEQLMQLEPKSHSKIIARAGIGLQRRERQSLLWRWRVLIMDEVSIW
jgi:hypothetical protein